MSPSQRIYLQISGAILTSVIPMVVPQLPLEWIVSLIIIALGLGGHAMWLAKDAALHSWQSWMPQLSAMVPCVALIVWVERQPGDTQPIGYWLIGVASILITFFAITVLKNLRPGEGIQASPAGLTNGVSEGPRRSENKNSILSPEMGAMKSVPRRPDWPIRDLFFHIDPHVLDDSNSTVPWLRVGRIIRDCQANHGLTVWGRTVGEDWEENFLEANALQLAPNTILANDYFQHADFTYLFFSEDNRFALHASPRDIFSDHPLYADLMVNRVEALAILQQLPPIERKTERLGSLELISLLEFRNPAIAAGWDLDGDSLEQLDLLDGLNGAGPRGAIGFLARSIEDDLFDDFTRNKPRKEISKQDWENLELGSGQFLMGGKDNFATVLHRRNPISEVVYRDVFLNRAQAIEWLNTAAREFKGRRARNTAG